jgi:hypothetical protein
MNEVRGVEQTGVGKRQEGNATHVEWIPQWQEPLSKRGRDARDHRTDQRRRASSRLPLSDIVVAA